MLGARDLGAGDMRAGDLTAMCMRKLAVAAVLAAATASATPSMAADLGYNDSPYSDPRYSDIYRHPAPPPPAYTERYAPPPAYRESYPVPAVPVQPQRHGQDAPPGCTPRHLIKDRLESRGWQDFHDPQPMGNVVHIRARRPSGRLFDITLDRCSGEVLGIEPLDRRAAEAPPPDDWRYARPRFERY